MPKFSFKREKESYCYTIVAYEYSMTILDIKNIATAVDYTRI